MITSRTLVLSCASVGLAVSLLLTGCGSDGQQSVGSESSSTTGVAGASTTTPASASASGADGDPVAGDPSSDESSSGGSAGGGSGSGSSPAVSIEEFGSPASVDCSGDDPQVSFSWSTRNADRVTISVDGPGVYAEYGPSGETAILFPCPGPHTYLLTAYGPDGTTRTEIVTVSGDTPPAVEGDESGTPPDSVDGSGGN